MAGEHDREDPGLLVRQEQDNTPPPPHPQHVYRPLKEEGTLHRGKHGLQLSKHTSATTNV